MDGLKEIWNRLWLFVWEWWSLLCWAVVCLKEELMKEEVSCPDCWKCELSRLVVLLGSIITLISLIKMVL